MPMRSSLGANSTASAAEARCACATRCANSWSVSSVRSPKPFGRSMGTPMLPGQMPCRSGSPHAVLGGVHTLVAVCWAKEAGANGSASATKISNRRMAYLLLLVLPVEQLFSELHAFELEDLRVL